MNYKYLLSCLLVFTFFVTACSNFTPGPEKIIQFEIEEQGIAENQKENTINNVQNRLIALGANDVKIVVQDQQKITYSYRGNIKPEILKKSFSIVGKLEFFEVCKEQEILYKYFYDLDEAKKSDTLKVALNADVETELMTYFTGFLTVIRMNNPSFSHYSEFGFVDADDKKKIAPLLDSEPVLIPGLKKRVKFLLGKSDKKNESSIYALYVTSTGKAPLDGSYVTHADAEYGRYGDGRCVISIQMDTDGGYIWERLTEKVYQERGNIAVVIDDLVHIAPTVSAGKIIGGMTEISGDFTKEEAEMLSSAIQSGTIPKMKILKMATVE